MVKTASLALAVLLLTAVPAHAADDKESVREVAYHSARSRGYTLTQWRCLDLIIYKESRWNPKAVNGSHYGLGQIRNLKPGTPYKKQLTRIFEYINHRYKTPCVALAHHKRYGWY